jgi:hypothetical protein
LAPKVDTLVSISLRPSLKPLFDKLAKLDGKSLNEEETQLVVSDDHQDIEEDLQQSLSKVKKPKSSKSKKSGPKKKHVLGKSLKALQEEAAQKYHDVRR